MKKITILFVALLLLTSCGKGEKTVPTASPAPTEAQESVSSPEARSVSARPCASMDELIEELTERPESSLPEEYVCRGDCAADLSAYTEDYACILTDYSVKLCRLDSAGAVLAGSVDVGYFWKEEETEGNWSGSEKQCCALLLSDTRLAVLSDTFDYTISQDEENWSSLDTSRCTVDIYDISSPSEPRWMRSFSQSGSMSCALICDGRLYLVTNREVYADDSFGEGALPGYWEGELWQETPIENISLCESGSSSYLQLGVYSLEGAEAPQLAALVGCGEQCLLCERGLYGLIPSDSGCEVYFLAVEDGEIAEPIGSFLDASYDSVDELTGAGESLCLLQDGRLSAEKTLWERRYDDGRILALETSENSAVLSLLSGESGHELLASRHLGFDFLAAADCEESVFVDSERGIVGLSSEDGYSLYSYDEANGFSHILDCYSSGYFGNRRVCQKGNLLFVSDMTRLFTINLDTRKILKTVQFY